MPTDEGLMMLIEEGHISYFERARFGFSGHDVVPFGRLVGVIVNELLQNGRFPRGRTKCDVPEGMWITRENEGFSVSMSRTLAENPDVVAERAERSFPSAEAAVRHYLKWECQLPGVLDGVRFV